MGRRKRCIAYVCLFPVLLCLSYLFSVYSIYKRNSQHIYEYELHRQDTPIWLSSSQHQRQAPFEFLAISDHRLISADLKRQSNRKLSSRDSHENDSSSHNGLERGVKPHVNRDENYIVIKGDLLSNEGEYLGGVRTDVDRTEDRKRKKKRKKFKKELKERCRRVETACKELKVLQEEEEKYGSFANGTYRVPMNSSSEKEPGWSSYADKGFTIVGKEGSLMRRLPHVLIIGAKKAGTRALLEFLRLHPSVTAAGAELHFFDRYFYRGPAWYRNNLPPSLEGQLTIEKTPAYFVDRDVPARVKQFLPSVKLLLVVRNPVVRAISDFTQSLSNHGPKESFRNLVLKNASSGLVNVAWGPVRGGLYARHYQKWRKYFPASSIHVVSGEGLVSDPAGEMASVQEFLNIQKVINNRHFYFNATKGFPCLMKREKNGKPHCLGFSKGRVHPKVDEDTLQILRDFYRPFNAKFYRLAGRDFGWP